MSSGATKSLPNGDSKLIEESVETEESSDKEKTDSNDKDPDEKSEEKKEDGGSNADTQEVVLIQDTGFTIQIVCPGIEPFELPVSVVCQSSLLIRFRFPFCK